MAATEGAKTPHDALYFYWNNELQAVRSGVWKLHFPHQYRSLTGKPGQDGKPNGYSEESCGLELYNLADDLGERNNLAELAREDLGDTLTKRPSKNARAAGAL